jgi:hypothetical protein
MDDLGINLREQISRTDLDQATSQRTFVEVSKLNAEALKLNAEARKHDRERTTAALVAGAALATAGAAIGGLVVRLQWG